MQRNLFCAFSWILVSYLFNSPLVKVSNLPITKFVIMSFFLNLKTEWFDALNINICVSVNQLETFQRPSIFFHKDSDPPKFYHYDFETYRDRHFHSICCCYLKGQMEVHLGESVTITVKNMLRIIMMIMMIMMSTMITTLSIMTTSAARLALEPTWEHQCYLL